MVLRRSLLAFLGLCLAGCGTSEPRHHGLTVPQWSGLLDSEDLPILAAAFSVLDELDAEPERVSAVAFSLLRSDDPGIVAMAVDYIESAGAVSTPELVEAVESVPAAARPGILKLLIGRGEVGIPTLERLFRAGAEDRREVIRVLGRSGALAGPYVEFLLRATRDPDPVLRRDAYHALVAIGKDAALKDDDVLPGLADAEVTVRFAAAWAAGVCGVSSPNVVRALEEQLGDPGVRPAALRALAYLGSDARAALPTVLPLLGHESPQVRKNAVETVSALGEGDPRAVEGLRALLEDPDLLVRRTSLRTLVAWGLEPQP